MLGIVVVMRDYEEETQKGKALFPCEMVQI